MNDFLIELSELMSRYSAEFVFDIGEGSDTHGVHGEHAGLAIGDTEVTIAWGYGFDAHDLKQYINENVTRMTMNDFLIELHKLLAQSDATIAAVEGSEATRILVGGEELKVSDDCNIDACGLRAYLNQSVVQPSIKDFLVELHELLSRSDADITTTEVDARVRVHDEELKVSDDCSIDAANLKSYLNANVMQAKDPD